MQDAVTHAIGTLSSLRLDGIAVDTVGRGRHVLAAADATIDTLVVPTGSAWFRIAARDAISLAVVHGHEPFGRSIISMLDERPLDALQALTVRCRGLVTLDDGRWSASPDARKRRRYAADLLDASCTACIARDDALEYAETMLEWDGDEPLVSFASSGSLDAPTPSALLTDLLRTNGFVETVAGCTTWQVVGSLFGGTAPSWSSPDGIVFDRGDSVSYDVDGVVTRMRAIASGSSAAERVGVEVADLLD